jgi:CheY-like chemotaxis protein
MSSQLVNVLLVEDNALDAELLMRSFRKLNIHNPITLVHDGIEALAALRGEGGFKLLPRPYLILLDINMPRMNGLEFLQVIRDDLKLKHSVVYILLGSESDKARFAPYGPQLMGFLLKENIGAEFLALPDSIKLF